jgi:hypothetical protein
VHLKKTHLWPKRRLWRRLGLFVFLPPWQHLLLLLLLLHLVEVVVEVSLMSVEMSPNNMLKLRCRNAGRR